MDQRKLLSLILISFIITLSLFYFTVFKFKGLITIGVLASGTGSLLRFKVYENIKSLLCR
jgi:hypothetical protein